MLLGEMTVLGVEEQHSKAERRFRPKLQ
jgi:hypothetical protein